MKKLIVLLVLFVFAAAFILHADDAMAPIKWSFMELLVATGADNSMSTRSNTPGADYMSSNGFFNVVDISLTTPVKKTDMVDASISWFLEWDQIFNGGWTAPATPSDQITSFWGTFEPIVKIGKNYTFYAGDEWGVNITYNVANGISWDTANSKVVSTPTTGSSAFGTNDFYNLLFQKNDISIPKVMEIWIVENFKWDYPNGTTQFNLAPAWSIGGPGLSAGDNVNYHGDVERWGDSYDEFWFHYVGPQYDNGFGWNIAQTYNLQFNLAKAENNDP